MQRNTEMRLRTLVKALQIGSAHIGACKRLAGPKWAQCDSDRDECPVADFTITLSELDAYIRFRAYVQTKLALGMMGTWAEARRCHLIPRTEPLSLH